MEVSSSSITELKGQDLKYSSTNSDQPTMKVCSTTKEATKRQASVCTNGCAI